MSFRELLARAVGALGAGRRDRELGQELMFHLEMLEERHRARGLDPEAARRAARVPIRRALRIDPASALRAE